MYELLGWNLKYALQYNKYYNKKLSYHWGTARYFVSVEILPVATQLSPQCRNCSRDPDHAQLGNTHSSQY